MTSNKRDKNCPTKGCQNLIQRRSASCRECHRNQTRNVGGKTQGSSKEAVKLSRDQERTKAIWECLDKNKAEKVDWRKLPQISKQHREIKKKVSSSQTTANVKVTTDDDWYGVVFSSDWHFGSSSCDVDSLMYHIDNVLNGPFHLITCGDLIDNFKQFKNVSAILQQEMSPKEQGIFLAGVIDEMNEKKKLIAGCWGNHDDDFDGRIGASPEARRLIGNKSVFFNGKGVLNLTINKNIKYSISLAHHWSGKSIYNPTHGQMRSYKDFYPADVIVGAHTHNFSYQYISMYDIATKMPDIGFGGYAHLIQLGTFKTGEDEYSLKYFNRGREGVPVVLFNTKKREAVFVPNYDLALAMYNGTMAKKKKKVK